MEHYDLQGAEGAQSLNFGAEAPGLVIYSIGRRTHIGDLSLGEPAKDAIAAR